MKQESQREKILDFIQSYITLHGYGPSVREISEALRLRSTATVHYHLRTLEQEGRILTQPGKKRAISLPRTTEQTAGDAGRTADPAEAERARQDGPDTERSVPVVGTVAAGQPILAVENIDGWLPWEGGAGWFALRVRGESMKNAGILPGDLVVVRPQSTAENGEIVVALLGDEATVKRFSRHGGAVWLLPENEAFSPIDGRGAAILGVVRGVVRTYD